MFLQETPAPFEYCFLKNIANPPNNNLTVRIVDLNMHEHHVICSFYLTQIEEHLVMDYQVLKDLTVPLRDVVNYEARIKNDSDPDTYQKLIYAEGQLNISLRKLGNMVSKIMHDNFITISTASFILSKTLII